MSKTDAALQFRSAASADLIRSRIDEAIAVCERLKTEPVIEVVEQIVQEMCVSLADGGRVLLCGNGGSAADAQHLAAELVGRFQLDRQPLAGISLSDNVAAVTAIGNDYAYDVVFERAVRGIGRPGDVLIGMSTSGRSVNVIRALEAGSEMGLVTVAFVGPDESPMASAAAHALRVDGPSTARIQEGQMLAGHIIFELVEKRLCGG